MQETNEAAEEIMPQTVEYPYIDSYKLEAFDRNPTGLLIELANSRKWRLLFTEFEQVVVEGKNMFSTSVVVNGKKFPARCAAQKKQARKDASLLALKLSYFKTSGELRPGLPDGQPTKLEPEQELQIAQALGLSPEDVAEADANFLPYEELGNEDAYGGYAEDCGQGYDGSFEQQGFMSFEGQATFDEQGNMIAEGNGQSFPIPQFGTKPLPPSGQRRKRRGGAGGGAGDGVTHPKKVKKDTGPKSPVGALLEYAQKAQVTVKFEIVSESGPSHKPSFVMAAVVGERTFPSVVCSGKKSGRAEAALIALRMLSAEGTFTDPNVDLWPVKPEIKVESEGDVAMAAEEPKETVTGSLPPVKEGEKVKGLTSESFALIHKHPISALMEYAQQRRLKATIETISERGPSHDSVFELAAKVGERTFPSVECKKKKFGRLMAADKALRTLLAEGEYISQLTTGPAELATITEDMTHFDKMAALSHQTFNSLIGELAQNIPGRKVLAAIIMKQGEKDLGTVVSVGSGNRCISGEQLSLEGTTVNDSHAEVIARRSFLRYLYKKLEGYDPKEGDQLFEPSVTGKTRTPQKGKLRVKEGITFHLYISTAPCGDGALFSPRDASFVKQAGDLDIESREHKPTFSSDVQGLLRTKVEGGEGTIPVDNDLIPQTWDGLQRGERLRTMSCTDKICRWNVVGIQGALLSHFIEPIYLDSVTIGFLYDHGHLARALCCRLTKGDSPIQALLPMGYTLNHPLLGRVTVCKPPRDTYKTRALSLNWCLGDPNSEVIDGTLGMCRQKPEDELPKFSRLCKHQLYEQYKTLCTKFGKKNLFNPKNYTDAKQKATEYQNAKKQLFKVLQKNKFGTWVCKPAEEELFT